ncbi:MAG: hypothetical protein KatS3mg103_0899 [Phycisphaerales bacterium]|nr:MAG: hypothetical protein KatS3mg103_0899 [Phycisphaerales bacterium]
MQEGPQGPALWRRRDMAFDPYQDAGGIAEEVARDVVSFSVLAGDTQGLWTSWDSDRMGLPNMVVIEVRTRSADGRAEAVARRVASLPRVWPQPTPTESQAGGNQAAGGGGS